MSVSVFVCVCVYVQRHMDALVQDMCADIDVSIQTYIYKPKDRKNEKGQHTAGNSEEDESGGRGGGGGGPETGG